MEPLVWPRRWLPWVACTACLAVLVAWGCGNTNDAPGSPDPERRAHAMLAPLATDGGDDAASAFDAGDASTFGDAGTGAPCTSDSVCIEGDYCASTSTCQPQLGAGSTCSTSAGGDCRVAGCRECTSGFCDNGICCGTSSCPDCETCSAALQQPFADGGTPGNGLCAPVVAGMDPQNVCPTPAPDSCRGDGECNGQGACQTLSPEGTSCGNPTCSGNSSTTSRCNGFGTCLPSSVSCAPYACESGSCATTCATNTDCASPATCNLGTCGTTAANGTSCETSSQCASGVCIDGVCCNTGCTGQCQACDVGGNIGTCTTVTGAPHGTRAACLGGGAEDGGSPCAGACDGTNASTCSYAGATTSCGASCTGSALTTGVCNGDGGCGSLQTFPCLNDYACQSATACNTSCQQNTDCATGAVCAGNTCAVIASACAGNTSVNTVGDEDAGVIPCGAYLCLEDAGTCTTSCKSASDCAPGAICNAQGECGTSTKSSCSCDVVGGGGSGGGAYGLAIAIGLVLTRRRRR